MRNIPKNKTERLTAVLRDLGFSLQSKRQCVLAKISKKSKNWEGFPQTSQSHKTLVVSLNQKER